MLENLYIQNYAIIEELDIALSHGLTVITGETGAGKSIMLGALSLILGERADSSVLVDKEKKCIVEGTFTTDVKSDVNDYLAAEGYDVEEKIIIRREINTNGKSRAFINDTPATVSMLAQVGSKLIDLHRQFDNTQLHDNAFQFSILDYYARQQLIVSQYQNDYQTFLSKSKHLETLRQQAHQAEAESEYFEYLHDELDQAAFQPGEIEALDEQIKQINHQEEIHKNVLQAIHLLGEQDDNAILQIKTANNGLNSIADYQKSVEPLVTRLNSCLEEIKDIYASLQDIQDTEEDRIDIEALLDRQNVGYRLLKKHSVQTTDELIVIKQELADKLGNTHQMKDEIERAAQEVSVLQQQLLSQAQQISNTRKDTILSLEKSLHKLLQQVELTNAKIKVVITPATNFNKYGIDEIELLLDSNNTGAYLPLSKIASGGELSRIMLSIKSIISDQISVPTLIYDEVDSAISGEAIKQVSSLIKALSKRYQVIVITHQPQMAARGDQHLFIYKKQSKVGSHTSTQIRNLSPDERIPYIAQMIDGISPSAATIESVTMMMQS